MIRMGLSSCSLLQKGNFFFHKKVKFFLVFCHYTDVLYQISNCVMKFVFYLGRIGGVTILRKGGSDFISNGETGNSFIIEQSKLQCKKNTSDLANFYGS